MSNHSIVYWYPELENHKCGYCNNEKGNISHGMWAQSLTIEDYQNLIDRGWRRSGHYCYKPLMDQICCPMYTIKCEALKFRPSKSQKKIIKKFNKFVKDGELTSTSVEILDDHTSAPEFVDKSAPEHLTDKTLDPDDHPIEDSDTLPKLPTQEEKQHEEFGDKIDASKPKSGIGADPNKPLRKKAKIFRMERKKEKLLKRGMQLDPTEVTNEQKSLEEFLSEIPKDGRHKFKIDLVHPGSDGKEWEELKKIEFALYKKYQVTIHNDPPEKCKMDGFLRFLVQSPLQYVKFSKNTNSKLGFGSFHQLYWLNDRLIAVGVIDILPKCVSAVYFFYDPDYRNLTLGTYGSLREIELTKSLQQKIPSIKNYYMGFYIHSCPKMRYKGRLSPSLLLCPETYKWIPIEICVPKLDLKKYSRLNEDETATDHNACSVQNLDEMRVLVDRRVLLFKEYKRKHNGQELFSLIGQLVGQQCAKSLIFIADI